MKSLKEVLKSNRLSLLPVISNIVQRGDKSVIQLEVSAGAAMSCFKNPVLLKVDRGRHIKMSTTAELFLAKSNLYDVVHGKLVMSSHRPFPDPPSVRLGKDLESMPDFLARCSVIPDILELDRLAISGNVFFGTDTVLRGTVIIIAEPGETIYIPSGSILENKIVSGSLYITDH